MVYAGLTNGLFTVALTAVCSGLWFDSLSANPLGVSVLPLLLIGLLAHRGRDLLAREEHYDPILPGGGGQRAATPGRPFHFVKHWRRRRCSAGNRSGNGLSWRRAEASPLPSISRSSNVFGAPLNIRPPPSPPSARTGKSSEDASNVYFPPIETGRQPVARHRLHNGRGPVHPAGRFVVRAGCLCQPFRE